MTLYRLMGSMRIDYSREVFQSELHTHQIWSFTDCNIFRISACWNSPVSQSFSPSPYITFGGRFWSPAGSRRTFVNPFGVESEIFRKNSEILWLSMPWLIGSQEIGVCGIPYVEKWATLPQINISTTDVSRFREMIYIVSITRARSISLMNVS